MAIMWSNNLLILLNAYLMLSGCHGDDYDDMDSHYEGWMEPITIGSLMKIRHDNSGHLLHSHEISWGSGSQQQSVTAYPTLGDGNSLWQLYASYENHNFTHASAIECGDIVRLKHVKTKKWLHSHAPHRAPLSHKQEVTCFGDEANSDASDNWKVICNKKGSKADPDIINWWRRGVSFALQHVATKHYLFTSKKSEFNDGNCRGCPILGQYEVAASEKKVKGARWISSHGFYFRPFDFDDNPERYLSDDTDAKQEL
eukprot:176608_1